MGERGNTPPGQAGEHENYGKNGLRYGSHVYDKFFEALGFKRVRVMVDNNRGTVEVTLLKGRIWPLTWREKAYFKKLKCWGVCYTVRRMVRGIKLWDNRKWDID